jgi:hypothetical protein
MVHRLHTGSRLCCCSWPPPSRPPPWRSCRSRCHPAPSQSTTTRTAPAPLGANTCCSLGYALQSFLELTVAPGGLSAARLSSTPPQLSPALCPSSQGLRLRHTEALHLKYEVCMPAQSCTWCRMRTLRLSEAALRSAWSRVAPAKCPAPCSTAPAAVTKASHRSASPLWSLGQLADERARCRQVQVHTCTERCAYKEKDCGCSPHLCSVCSPVSPAS